MIVSPRRIEAGSYQLTVHVESSDHWPIYVCGIQQGIYYFKDGTLRGLFDLGAIKEWKI